MNVGVCLYCYMCGLIQSIRSMLCCVVVFTLNLVCLWSVVPKLSCDRTLLLIQS